MTNAPTAPYGFWSAVGGKTPSGGSSYFSDPQWTDHPSRFYRLRSLLESACRARLKS